MSVADSSYEAARQFLLDRIDYERVLTIPYSGEDFKLDRMRELLLRLGNPQEQLAIVHIAGTKGKGSTAAMLSAALVANGYRTGLFSSPHFERVEERFRMDGQPCSAAELVELVRVVRPTVEAMDRESGAASEIGPTYFEVTTAMAFVHFVRSRADAVVLEVGLGGRLDSTNVCTPRASVVTSISFDHTEQLGNTLAAIAREKAGIIKPGVPVVSGVMAADARTVIADVCRRQGAPLVELGTDFAFEYYPPHDLQQSDSPGRLDFRWLRPAPGENVPSNLDDLALSLPGRHQAANAAVALAAMAILRQAGWRIDEDAARRGLASVRWPGRAEVVGRQPAVVLDVAHNRASIEALLETLAESFQVRQRHLIFAASQGKDTGGMLEPLLGRFDNIVLTRYGNNPRATPPDQLVELAHKLTGRRYAAYAEASAAWLAVLDAAEPDDLICVTGSFFLAAEIRRLLTTGESGAPREM
ncbi:MAG: folylpolyglutamate synthase/dihydrofolate synthase family protein [Patescibacteria group bacterium]|nr:folylpolyglutamate synthase/dihydrofolate synthase family protein [Patescibacteria group bacterium]